MDKTYDLAIIGGGINGVGIARDAAGRGLSVFLCEQDDLASGTSSASSKLIHGGLRYLEQGELRLVAASLAEREVLLRIAPHLVHPQRFVMPCATGSRPAWLIQFGLFLYDHLSRRTRLPASSRFSLLRQPYTGLFKADIIKAFSYFDCMVDDGRLVVANAKSAVLLGATLTTRTKCIAAVPTNGQWALTLEKPGEPDCVIHARALVNAAGPWVEQVVGIADKQPQVTHAALVKGSHILVPKLYDGDAAFILQNTDRRVIFLIPYEQRYTLVGTTDVAIDNVEQNQGITAEEIHYLCQAVNRYIAAPIKSGDVVSSYSGVRALFDDGRRNPSTITRDYSLQLSLCDTAPLLSIFGGKITTYRQLAEAVIEKLAPFLPKRKPAWTASVALPGGDILDWNCFMAQILRQYPTLPPPLLTTLARRHGTALADVLGECKQVNELGECFTPDLFAREISYMINNEWALTADDILWRRTKAGLRIDSSGRARLERFMAAHSHSTSV